MQWLARTGLAAVLAAVLAVSTACEPSPAAPQVTGPAPEDTAAPGPPPAPTVGGNGALAVADTTFTLQADDYGVGVNLPLSFTNVFAEPVYIVNCNGHLHPRLDRWVEGAWRQQWTPGTNACLSPPIVIAPGATYTDTVRVWGATPGQNWYPEWPATTPGDAFRLVLYDMVFRYDSGGRPFGPPVPAAARTSNTFRLFGP